MSENNTRWLMPAPEPDLDLQIETRTNAWWYHWPLRVCRGDRGMECLICKGLLIRGESYYDAGNSRWAHRDCIPKAGPKSQADTAEADLARVIKERDEADRTIDRLLERAEQAEKARDEAWQAGYQRAREDAGLVPLVSASLRAIAGESLDSTKVESRLPKAP